MTITRDLEIPKHPTQMLKYKHAYLMLQVINYYKYVKSAHIIVTTFLLHYCERWLCQSKYTFTFKITASSKRARDCVISVHCNIIYVYR